MGAEKRQGAGEIDGLARTEQLLDDTGASVLHLRCGMFFTNLLLEAGALEDGVLRVAWPVDLQPAWVDPRDVGDVAAARLLATDWSGRQVQAVHRPARGLRARRPAHHAHHDPDHTGGLGTRAPRTTFPPDRVSSGATGRSRLG